MTEAITMEPTPPAATSSPVVVVASSPSSRAAALALARTLNLPCVDAPSAASGLRLMHTDGRLELHDPDSGARLYVEFTLAALRRYRAGGPGGDPLRRAIGPGDRHVVDATAGLGRDAVHLAVLGYQVTGIERHAVVSSLAQDGLRRARAEHLLIDNPRWHTGDARILLPQLTPAPSTIYLDPMFPPKRKKSAAVRKEMHLLRLLVGAQPEDALELLRVARRVATDRVVVKRPIDAAALARPRASYAGKLIRYDVYRG